MKKITNKELIKLIAENTIRINQRLDRIEEILRYDEELLDEYNMDKNSDLELQTDTDKEILFTKELYDKICKHCNIDSIQFMGIA